MWEVSHARNYRLNLRQPRRSLSDSRFAETVPSSVATMAILADQPGTRHYGVCYGSLALAAFYFFTDRNQKGRPYDGKLY